MKRRTFFVEFWASGKNYSHWNNPVKKLDLDDAKYIAPVWVFVNKN